MPIIAFDYASSVGRQANLLQWDHRLNELSGFLPKTIAFSEKQKVWWRCPTCDSTWRSTVGVVLARDELGCYTCYRKMKSSRSLSDFPLDEARYEKLLSEWDKEKSGFGPEHKLPKNDDLVFWICSNSHSWSASLRARTKKQGTNCPYCKPNRLITGFNDLETVCLADPQLRSILQEWDTDANLELGLTPQSISANDGKKSVYWRCLKAGHSWRTSPGNRMSGRGCSICSGRYADSGVNDLLTLAETDERIGFLMTQWISDRNLKAGIDPSALGRGSNKKAWWRCSKGHEWFAQIDTRVIIGYDCRKCSSNRSKGEIELYEFLQSSLDGLSVDHNVRGVVSGFELDIFIEEIALGIEYNGNYWHSDEKLTEKGEWSSAEEYHQFKLTAAEKAGVQLIFVWEDDWKTRRAKMEASILALISGSEIDSLLRVLTKG